jgi:hypothetical protein
MRSPTQDISSVWRFGRDSRHPMNKGSMDSSGGRYIVRNLQRIQISLDPGTNRGDGSTSHPHADPDLRVKYPLWPWSSTQGPSVPSS